MSRILILDTEGTGYEICQIGAVVADTKDWSLLGEFEQTIVPVVKLENPKAMAVHGLTREYLLQHGISPNSALSAFELFARGFHTGIIATDIYDIEQLRNEYALANRMFPYQLFPYKRPGRYWDLNTIWNSPGRIKSAPTTLNGWIKDKGVNDKDRHSALGDAKITFEVLRSLYGHS